MNNKDTGEMAVSVATLLCIILTFLCIVFGKGTEAIASAMLVFCFMYSLRHQL